MAKNKIKLLLDSGAFSAWRQKKPVDLDEYIRYIHDNESFITHPVNLDVIPGEFGRKPTPDEVEYSAREGWKNLKHMEAEGISAIPVFHQGEEFKWLYKLLDEGYDYIGISPDNGKPQSQKNKWLDDVYAKICDMDGRPLVKTHGFAVTSIKSIFRYPWYTVDSMTWLLAASYGGVFVPQWKDGGFTHRVTPWTVKISEKSPTKKQGIHFDNFGKEAQKHILEYWEELGVTYEELTTDFKARTISNVHYLQSVQRELNKAPIKFENRHRNFFFSERANEAKGNSRISTIIYAVNLARRYSDILTDLDENQRLFSYFLLRDTKEGFLKEYVATGRLPESKKRTKK